MAVLQSCRVAMLLLSEMCTTYIEGASVRYMAYKATRQTDSNVGDRPLEAHTCTFEFEKHDRIR